MIRGVIDVSEKGGKAYSYGRRGVAKRRPRGKRIIVMWS